MGRFDVIKRNLSLGFKSSGKSESTFSEQLDRGEAIEGVVRQRKRGSGAFARALSLSRDFFELSRGPSTALECRPAGQNRLAEKNTFAQLKCLYISMAE